MSKETQRQEIVRLSKYDGARFEVHINFGIMEDPHDDRASIELRVAYGEPIKLTHEQFLGLLDFCQEVEGEVGAREGGAS